MQISWKFCGNFVEILWKFLGEKVIFYILASSAFRKYSTCSVFFILCLCLCLCLCICPCHCLLISDQTTFLNMWSWADAHSKMLPLSLSLSLSFSLSLWVRRQAVFDDDDSDADVDKKRKVVLKRRSDLPVSDSLVAFADIASNRKQTAGYQNFLKTKNNKNRLFNKGKGNGTIN